GGPVGEDQRDRAAPGPEADALLRAVSPGPRADSVVVVDEDALVLGPAFEGPGGLPGEAVKAVRLGWEVGRKRDVAVGEAEARVADAVAPGGEGEAGGVERAGRGGGHRTQDVLAAMAQGGERAADVGADFGGPVGGGEKNSPLPLA